MLKIAVQSSSFKIQGSISNTPEGSHTERARLTVAEDGTIDEDLDASIGSINLRRRPIAGASESVPSGSTNITRIVELSRRRNKPVTRIKAALKKSGVECWPFANTAFVSYLS
jgi:hypothetical protein